MSLFPFQLLIQIPFAPLMVRVRDGLGRGSVLLAPAGRGLDRVVVDWVMVIEMMVMDLGDLLRSFRCARRPGTCSLNFAAPTAKAALKKPAAARENPC